MSGMAPLAISVIVGSTLRIALANRLCLASNCVRDIAPYCQSPHASLPMFQNFTRNGSGWPLAARIAPIACWPGYWSIRPIQRPTTRRQCRR